METLEYTAVIRTLGLAGSKYQRLLDSLKHQDIQPKAIYVYIADGYQIPKETIGVEKYVYVNKGMLAQRALPYDEVETEYILFLDDDLEFPHDTVGRMYELLKENDADIISPDIFPNADRGVLSEIMMTLSGRMRARRNDPQFGYKVMSSAGYSYNKNPEKEVYLSQTNAGACFLCKKSDFLKIRFEDEAWLDNMTYSLGDDQVMFYKMYCAGLRQLTWYRHNFVHLDAGNSMTPERELKNLYGDVYFKQVFWHRFLFLPERSCLKRIWLALSMSYYMLFTFLVSFCKLRFDVLGRKLSAFREARAFIRSDEYKSLPVICNKNE